MQSRILLLVLALAAVVSNAADNIEVYFSPKGGATEAIVRELGKAKAKVLVAAYAFTSAPIAKALKQAHERGVKVSVILDSSNESSKYSSATFLLISGRRSVSKNSPQIKREDRSFFVNDWCCFRAKQSKLTKSKSLARVLPNPALQFL